MTEVKDAHATALHSGAIHPSALHPNSMGPCPVCGQTLSRPISSCAQCHTPHHADCWDYNEGCSIFGCGAKPLPPPTATRPAILPRLAFLAVFAALFGMFALGGRTLDVRVEDLSVDSADRVPVATWMTTPRSRSLIEVVRADQPDIVLYRRHTPRSQHHRVELPFIKANETYLVRVTSQSGIWSSETLSQLYRAPDEAPPHVVQHDALRSPPPGVYAPTLFVPSAPALGAAPEPAPFVPTPVSDPPSRAEMRDPFRMPGHGVQIRVRPEDHRGPFGSFDIRVGAHEANVMWRTKSPQLFCRVLILRDSTLKGVEKVSDAATRPGGTFHRVSLENLEPDTSYQLLVLAFPPNGDPIQSPVLAFRTLP